MRRYLLDSPIVTGYLKGRKVVTLVEPWIEENQAATSLLVYEEVSEYNQAFPTSLAVKLNYVRFYSRFIPMRSAT